ncbi:MAG: glycosyltransferase [Planctomycetes bacterium]|nr:glycosyltransferase [Planctomycetota bacterium]
MPKTDYAITFACHNAVDYTKKCVESLVASGTPLDRVVAVDNLSTDGTPDYLRSLPLGGLILNSANMPWSIAMNQGILALQAEWTFVMNNDILASAGWIEGLIGTANRLGLRVISPAMVELEFDYDFPAFAVDATTRMAKVERRGGVNPVCLVIHKSVFAEAGYFHAEPRLYGAEDELFFHALRSRGIETTITGAAWLHHFGSITQLLVKQSKGMKPRDSLTHRNKAVRFLDPGYWSYKFEKTRRLRQQQQWRDAEVAAHGMSLHGKRQHGAFQWY